MKLTRLLVCHPGTLYARRQGQPLVPVVLIPDSWSPLQNKAQDVVLGTYAVPDEEGDGVVFPQPGIVPFLGSELADTCAHPVMQAFLFCLKEFDNVHNAGSLPVSE